MTYRVSSGMLSICSLTLQALMYCNCYCLVHEVCVLAVCNVFAVELRDCTQ